MNVVRRAIARFGPMFLVVAVQGALLSGPNIAPSQGAPVPEKPFATVVEPIGVAATPAGFGYVTRPLCTSETNPTRQVAIFDSTGSIIRRLALPNISDSLCRELYIAVAPGPADNTIATGYPTPNPAGFTSNELYVTDGGIIFVIRLKRNPNGSVALNPDGSPQFLAPVTFAPVSESSFGAEGACGSSRTGIIFDEVGTFGYKLIVTCSNGKVWSFDNAGNASLITTITGVPGPFEGPVVAPCQPSDSSCTGPFRGNLLVAAENAPARCFSETCPPAPNGEVFAVSPTGIVTPVANVPSAEGVTIIPQTKCTFGLTNGFTYFTAIFKPAGAAGRGGTIDQLPRSAFEELGGKALVTSENGEPVGDPPTRIGIALVSSPGVVTEFRRFFHEHQGSAFVDCLVPVLVRIRVIRHDATVTVRIFSNRNFFSGNLIPSTARFGPYTTEPGALAIRCKLAKKRGEGDQGGDRNVNQTGQNENQRGESDDEDENARKGTTTCTFPNNLAPGQLGVIKFKYNDPAGPGDGDGEGGG